MDVVKVYLAGRNPAKLKLQEWRVQLYEAGHPVISRWLDNGEETHTGWAHAAQRDLDDVFDCQALVADNPVEWAFEGHGGRHVELGMAVAWGKVVIVVGEPTNVFHTLKEVLVVRSVEEAIGALATHQAVWDAAAPWHTL